jgi:ABC-type multidrug transport system permease subunit
MSEEKSVTEQGGGVIAAPTYAGEVPTGPFVISLVSGVLILLGALVPLVFMGSYGGMEDMMGGSPSGGLIDTDSPIFHVLGAAFGVVVLFGTFMLNSRPLQHTTWGALILIFAALSPFGAMGGFMIGMVAGLVGGAWAIAWKPTYTDPPTSGRFCPDCGRGISIDARFCSYCGYQLPA